jgi:aminopeptidase N
VAVAAALALTAASAAPAAAQFTPGASGLGDPFFPDAGNGGYDVLTYDIDLSYRPDSDKLHGLTTNTAAATQNLSSFTLDLRDHLRVTNVSVAGGAATYSQSEQKLTVGVGGITSGSTFTTVVTYSGKPRNVVDPDGSKDGWVPTDDGAFVASEPQGAPTWFPCNDTPTDKAGFAFEISVPKGVEAIANGKLVERRNDGSQTTWSYRATEPMATYLATATIGQFRIDRSKVAGIPSVVAVDPRVAKGSRAALKKQDKMLRLWSKLFGPYPFGQTGVIVDFAPEVGYALETQTRPLFDKAADELTLAHEIAHQWFGDSVSLERWPDMWLNEGFATWAEWRWTEQQGGSTTAEMFRDLQAASSRSSLWDFPPAVIPEPSRLFATPVYARGAMALEALRQRIGDKDFYATLRDWASTNAYSNVNTDDFIATAEASSGEELDGLFQTWLYEPGKP